MYMLADYNWDFNRDIVPLILLYTVHHYLEYFLQNCTSATDHTIEIYKYSDGVP